MPCVCIYALYVEGLMPCELLLFKLRACCPVSVFMLYTLRA